MPTARRVLAGFSKSIAPNVSAELGVSVLMARTHGNEIVQLVLGSKGFEQLGNAAREPKLDAELAVRLAHFMLFLAEVEDCTGVLRDDEIEKVIEAAVADRRSSAESRGGRRLCAREFSRGSWQCCVVG